MCKERSPIPLESNSLRSDPITLLGNPDLAKVDIGFNMSGRKLGGGRILGNGKGLAPPAPPAIRRERATSPSAQSAPSDSTLSIGSPAASLSPGTSPLPDFAQDLASNISLGGPSNGSQSGSKLVCPICEEEMLTLLQLNRHIDDTHQELPEFEQDEVKSWIDKQVLKAKKFQPLSLINQKLRGLEVFESNESLPPPAPVTIRTSRAPVPDLPLDPDDIITKSHWQRPGPSDLCTDPACGKRALLPLQDENSPPSHAQIQEASKIRKRLTDSFTKYDVAARRIRDMKTDSPAQRQLQKAIHQAASSFLHMHMLPLKNLPRMLKHHSSSSSSSRNRLLTNGHVASPLRNGSDMLETASQTSETSTVVSALETEEKELRERLIVLEEQKYMVQKMINSAHGARRFEEVSALTRNVEELDTEIESIRSKVVAVEDRWQGLYSNGGPSLIPQ
ncbi:hypothetical protein ABKA04_009387 [Annulohypoxylon sp. FPYF3050]